MRVDDADDERSPTDDDPDYRCDFFGFGLPAMNSLRNIRFALAILCLSAMVQSFVCLGLIGVVISTLETRFRLSSSASGFIPFSYGLGQSIFVLPTTFFGGAGRKPRFLGVALMAIGVGSLIFSLPHFACASIDNEVDEARASLCASSTWNRTLTTGASFKDPVTMTKKVEKQGRIHQGGRIICHVTRSLPNVRK